MSDVQYTEVYSDVTAPPFTLPPYGLFSVVPFTTPADPHWQAGIQWNDWNCLFAAESGDLCIAGISTAMTSQGRCPTYSNTKPFTVYVEMLSGLSDSIVADTARVLTQSEQATAEAHLWDEFRAAAAWSAPIASADYLEALAAVEMQLRRTSASLGVIHMTPYAAAMLSKELFPSGSRLTTRLGTPVVVGSGYGVTRAHDAAEAPYIVGTGPMIAMRSSTFDSFGWSEEINDQVNLTQRTYVIGWDCAVVAAYVGTPPVVAGTPLNTVAPVIAPDPGVGGGTETIATWPVWTDSLYTFNTWQWSLDGDEWNTAGDGGDTSPGLDYVTPEASVDYFVQLKSTARGPGGYSDLHTADSNVVTVSATVGADPTVFNNGTVTSDGGSGLQLHGLKYIAQPDVTESYQWKYSTDDGVTYTDIGTDADFLAATVGNGVYLVEITLVDGNGTVTVSSQSVTVFAA